MRAYRALLSTLWASTRREPVGLFFTFFFAPLMVVILGLIFGNDPRPEFGDQGMLDATLPAFASLVPAMTGVLQLPVSLLTLRESGALTRLSLTPMPRAAFFAAHVTLHLVIGLVGMVAALAVGVVLFDVALPERPVLVLLAAAYGLVAFLALGYALSRLYPSVGAATAIGNILMILLMITSGAFTPLAVLPEGVRRVMELSPVRQLVELMQGLWVGAPLGEVVVPFLATTALLLVSAGFAALFRRRRRTR